MTTLRSKGPARDRQFSRASVGLGIDFWREFAGFGGEAADDRARAAFLDDGIEIITRLWSGERVAYEGTALSMTCSSFRPAPAPAFTWFTESFAPDEPLADVRRIINEGPPAGDPAAGVI